ncbi:MAG: TetR/AcrR family transcriptional regulator [Pseudomonadota bacterium]
MGRAKNYDRDDVLESALAVFWRKGYSATSLSDLTLATGLNKKSIYNEFGSKEALFDAVLARYKAAKHRQVQLLLREPAGVGNVVDYVERLAADASRKGCLFCLSIYEKETLEKAAVAGTRADYKAVNALIEKNLAEAAGARAKALSHLVSAQIFSVAGQGRLGLPKRDIDASMRVLIDAVLAPLLPA